MNQFEINSVIYDCSHIRGEVKINEAMFKHTTWKVGGEAKVYFVPESTKDLQLFLKLLKPNKHEILWLGLGSNTLIRDKGFNGVVINTVGKLKQIEFYKSTDKKMQVSVQSGMTCAKFSREIAAKGLVGAEFYSGIPGSMGGAIAMNAGAFGGECWENLDAVETISEQGRLEKKKKEAFDVAYRSVKGLKTDAKGIREWFIKGFFTFSKDIEGVKKSKIKIKKLLHERNEKQPISFANAGSVFKNPPGDYAARLIERCGLKNKQIGQAKISEKHANFIINMGKATSSDIENLMQLMQQKVSQKFSINLEPEVKIYG